MTPRPARVLVLLDTLVAEGAETVAVDLACALDRTRFEPRVIATRRGGPLEDRLASAGVPYDILGRSRRSSVLPMRHALKAARDSDIIHSHMFGSNVWGALLARLSAARLISHEHNWVAGWSSSQARIQRQWIAPAASRILCVSDEVLRSLLAVGVPAQLLRVVINGVTPAPALQRSDARRELGLRDADEVVGIVAALRPEKNHELLLDAFAQLPRHAESGARRMLCIVGDGECREQLRQRASELHLDSHVVWAGERSNAAQLFSAFDIATLPSKSEGLPLSALEAMQCGVPLVASAVGGLKPLLADGAGVLVAPNDVAALAHELETLLADPSLRHTIGQHGRDHAITHYGYDTFLAAIQGEYDSALGRDTQSLHPKSQSPEHREVA